MQIGRNPRHPNVWHGRAESVGPRPLSIPKGPNIQVLGNRPGAVRPLPAMGYNPLHADRRSGRRRICMRTLPRILSISMIVTLCLGCASSDSDVRFFGDEPIWSNGSDPSGGDGIARLIDFDRDGDLDFATSLPDPRRWALYPNEDGVISTATIWESTETTDCDHLDVLDFNGDGWSDLTGTHESYCTLYFNKSGSFETGPDWETSLIANANQIDYGDFDQDGDLDMVMAAGEPINGVALFRNDTGTPAQQPTLKLGHEEYAETAIFADYDADGDLDITAGYRGGKIVVYQNVAGAFEEGAVILDDKRNPWTQRLYWRDLDGDRRAELYCAKGPWGDQLGQSVQLVQPEGRLGMEVGWKSPPDSAFHAFEFGDIDGDGDLDVVASDYAHGGRVMLYLNEGDRVADEPAWSVQTSGPAHEAVLGDIDGDGDLDLAVGCRDQAHIYENLSTNDP